jgi:hypothetical protein
MDLFLGLLFGSVGGIYMVYGRRDHDPMFLIVGFALMVYPYFFKSALSIVLIGVILTAIPIARHKGYF